MNRRSFLATWSVTLGVTLGGCLQEGTTPGSPSTTTRSGENTPENTGGSEEKTSESGTTSTDEQREYEECELVSIDYEWLPRAIREEVDTARRDGQYETEGLLLAEAIDPDRSYVVIDGTPYEPLVESDSGAGTQTLEVRKADAVRLPDPRSIEVANSDDRSHDVEIVLRDGDTVVEETVTVEPDATEFVEATDRFGSYELTARTRTGHRDEAEFGFTVSDSGFDGYVEVTPEEITVTQEVADLEPCSWDATR